MSDHFPTLLICGICVDRRIHHLFMKTRHGDDGRTISRPFLDFFTTSYYDCVKRFKYLRLKGIRNRNKNHFVICNICDNYNSNRFLLNIFLLYIGVIYNTIVVYNTDIEIYIYIYICSWYKYVQTIIDKQIDSHKVTFYYL